MQILLGKVPINNLSSLIEKGADTLQDGGLFLLRLKIIHST
jgi:hypothetical protein